MRNPFVPFVCPPPVVCPIAENVNVFAVGVDVMMKFPRTASGVPNPARIAVFDVWMGVPAIRP
jgi:hypothetical protein